MSQLRSLQVWLAITNLVVDPKFRAKYQLSSYRKDVLSRVRRFLNDLLIDQLPVLKDLQRVVDEIALNYRPNFDAYESGALVIEQVLITEALYLLQHFVRSKACLPDWGRCPDAALALPLQAIQWWCLSV